MAHNNFPNDINNNRRVSSMANQNNYEYELKKLMEHERRSIAAQVRIL